MQPLCLSSVHDGVGGEAVTYCRCRLRFPPRSELFHLLRKWLCWSKHSATSTGAQELDQ